MANTQFIADLVSRVDQLLNQHNALQHTLQQTSAQLAQAEAERDTLRTQQEQHHTEQAALATQLSNAEAERDLVRALNGELAAKNAALTALVADLESQLSSMSTEHDLLRSRHAAARARIDALLDRLHKNTFPTSDSPRVID